MREETIVAEKEIENMDQAVLRAVYALNMCTVSVSQIIDYNDVYILEQEYDAILNNLNLEKMPKANALKNILVELLNTITFFRIQEIRKEAIEEKYQRRVRNAIWSAIPNLNVIVSGKPAAIAYSIATQIGIGYMNYRKEKNNAFTEKEKEELELRITAIEQFHALRRELFTTAWELAEEYEFDDSLRLTEKQIKQYNRILMDHDELRKYVRLESIQDKFLAFPPFWYNLGHTACYIAGDRTLPLEEWEREFYRKKAKEHFDQYEKLNKFNILREDQMTATFALEYVDLLLLEEKPDIEKITDLISVADHMSGTALDIKQLCAISYLKVGAAGKAAELLKQLVNEAYNTRANAKLLSRIYVSQFLQGDSQTAKFDYKTLQMRVGYKNAGYLFPMPDNKTDDKRLQTEYLVDLKTFLATDYNMAINQFLRKYTILFHAVIPAPYGYECFEEYYGYTEKEMRKRSEDIQKVLNDNADRSAYLESLADVGFRFKFIDLLNEALEACDDLTIWRESENHDRDVKCVRTKIGQKKFLMKRIQDNISAKKFTVEDYKTLQLKLSFRALMEEMLDNLKNTLMEAVHAMDSMEEIENAEYNLAEFCQKNGISLTESYDSDKEIVREMQAYLDYSLLGSDGIDEKQKKEILDKKTNLVKSASVELVIGNTREAAVLLPGEERFDLYFRNKKFKAGSLKEKTLCIIDDNTKKDCDLLFAQDQFIIIKQNKIKSYHSYDHTIKYSKSDKHGESIQMGVAEYANKNINIGRLYKLIGELKDVDNALRNVTRL